MKIAIADDTVALMPLAYPPDLLSWLVVREPTLVRALIALCWERSVPLPATVEEAQQAGQGAPTQRERDLLALLAAGHSDQVIADHLGCNVRTARRHLRALLTRLDAVTRFQAGYQAAQRGWLIQGGIR